MPVVSLVALKSFPYASGSIAIGDVFQALSSFDAAALIAGGMASPEPARRLMGKAEAVVAYSGCPEGHDVVEPVPARRYKRKDVVAE